MISILEKMILVFGAYANFLLVSNLLIRPVLWSTNNIFLGCFLSINFFYLIIQIFIGDANDQTIPDGDMIIQYFEYSFSDNYKAIICSIKYISQYIHGSFTLCILCGSIFIRSMMVKHADNIRTNNLDCKSHQAYLSDIGILAGILILTIWLGLIITMIIAPISPVDYVLVQSCRGVPISYSEEEMRKKLSHVSSRFVILVVFALGTLSSQVRISYFRKHHNGSYFSKFRQNIATIDQSLAAAYLRIAAALVKEVMIFVIIRNSTRIIQFETYLKIRNILMCVVIPCYWIYSTKKDFPEFWSEEMCFWTKDRRPKTLLSFKMNLIRDSPLEPRRVMKGFKPTREIKVSRIFSYILKSHQDDSYKVFRQLKPIPLLKSNTIHNSPSESRSPHIQESWFINEILKPTRETLDSGIFSYICKNHQDILCQETCPMPTVSGPELCHISYSNEKANRFIETDTILNLESELVILKDTNTDNEKDNYEEQGHEFITTNQCSCVGKAEAKFQCYICKKYFCEQCQAGPLKLEKQSKCIECLMLELESEI